MEDVDIRVAHDERIVLVDFGVSLSDMRLSPSQARAFAHQLVIHANAVDPERPLQMFKPKG